MRSPGTSGRNSNAHNGAVNEYQPPFTSAVRDAGRAPGSIAGCSCCAEGPMAQSAGLVQIWIGPNTHAALAAFDYPGVVRVTMRYTGELIAQSKPGHPSELDPCAS